MVESAPYEVLRTVDDIEVRAYPRLIVATVDGSGDDDSAFGHLFRYITGVNTGSRRIAMTTPVITPERIEMTAPVINRGWEMPFVMPADYTMDTMPEPTDPMVRIEELPARKMAVIRFKGRTREREVEAARERLYAVLDRQSMEAVGAPVLMRYNYNSPFTPGFLRKNEVGVQLRD
jgi:hypothetical protein